ncbi:MAG: Carboxymuconolactone decarboxylase [Symbiobacteriaceae bacterium]|jgi:AhpD family alkylhydroperoxidase|nr:Carboxymuconolactone decarboxylase [Symbiobacteriaceae bacterium]
MAARMVSESEAGALSGLYGEIRTRLGLSRVPGVFKAMAAVSHDVLVQNWTAFRHTVLEGALPRTVKQMIALVVAREQGCGYGVNLFSEVLCGLGVETPVVRSLAEHGDCADFPLDLRRLLAFARAYCVDPDGVDPDSLEFEGFSEEDSAEVVDAVLMTTGLVRFAAECGLAPDGDMK